MAHTGDTGARVCCTGRGCRRVVGGRVDGPADGLCVEVGAHVRRAVARARAQEERHREGRAEPPRLEGGSAEEARLEPWVCTLRRGCSHAAGGK